MQYLWINSCKFKILITIYIEETMQPAWEFQSGFDASLKSGFQPCSIISLKNTIILITEQYYRGYNSQSQNIQSGANGHVILRLAHKSAPFPTAPCYCACGASHTRPVHRPGCWEVLAIVYVECVHTYVCMYTILIYIYGM